MLFRGDDAGNVMGEGARMILCARGGTRAAGGGGRRRRLARRALLRLAVPVHATRVPAQTPNS